MERTNEMCSFGKDEYGLQTGTVKISELHEFKGHPFKVENDIQLFELMWSIELCANRNVGYFTENIWKTSQCVCHFCSFRLLCY